LVASAADATAASASWCLLLLLFAFISNVFSLSVEEIKKLAIPPPPSIDLHHSSYIVFMYTDATYLFIIVYVRIAAIVVVVFISELVVVVLRTSAICHPTRTYSWSRVYIYIMLLSLSYPFISIHLSIGVINLHHAADDRAISISNCADFSIQWFIHAAQCCEQTNGRRDYLSTAAVCVIRLISRSHCSLPSV
jgi:hypothetical protein